MSLTLNMAQLQSGGKQTIFGKKFYFAERRHNDLCGTKRGTRDRFKKNEDDIIAAKNMKRSVPQTFNI